jgi:hypothetical protein
MAKKRAEKGNRSSAQRPIEKPASRTVTAENPERKVSRRQRMVQLLVVGQILCFILLFFAVMGVPVARSLAGGFSGSNAVWKFSLLLAAAAAANCWMKSVENAGPDDDVDPAKDSPWPRFILLCVFIMCVNMYVKNMRDPHGWGLVTGNDQPQYFAYLHSWVFDHDLDFVNEYDMMPGIREMMKVYHPGNPGNNVAPIGSPVIWMPFYLAAHVFVWILRATGAGVVADGMSSPYAAGVGFASIFVAWLGFIMVYATLRKRFSETSALFSTLLVWLASPILWYLTDEAWMSHACSFFAAALVFWWWERSRDERSTAHWALLGAAIGLAMMVRPSHVVLFALPAADAIAVAIGRRWFRQTVKGLAACVVCGIAAFVPQLAVWWLRSGLHAPPGNPMQWTRPAVVPILFSAHHGLFAWHPVTLFGFIGVAFLWKKSRRMALAVGAVLILGTYMNAAIEDWPGGASFGMRRFVGLLPFMAPGLAAFGSWVVGACRANPVVPAGMTVVALFLYNNLFAVAYREYWIGPTTPVSFWSVWSTQASLFHRSFGNPFSYPANLWFAAKYGVSPGHYDLLGGRPSLKSTTIAAQGYNLIPFLAKGWQTQTRASLKPDSTFMAIERECTILLPLKEDTAYDVEIKMGLPKGFSEDSSVELKLNGHAVGQGKLLVDRTMNLKIKFKEHMTVDGPNVLDLSFAAIRKMPNRERTSMQGGQGLAVNTIDTRRCAALLHSLNVTPVEE